MANTRPHSRKVRALEATYCLSVAEIVDEARRAPHTYREIAGRWQAAVSEAFPDLNLRFTYQDVFQLFRAHGVQTEALMGGEAIPSTTGQAAD